MQLRLMLGSILGLSILTMQANFIPACKPLPFLNSGFDLKKYKACTTLMNQCPAAGALPSPSCAKEISKEPACQQLNKLAQAVNADLNQISTKQDGPFTLVDIYFPADGQNHYYIVTPQHCLIDTVVDLKKLNQKLAQQYPKTAFMTLNWDEPRYRIESDGTHNFYAHLVVTDTCVACKVLGYAKLKFNFAKQGNLIGVHLLEFSDHKPTTE